MDRDHAQEKTAPGHAMVPDSKALTHAMAALRPNIHNRTQNLGKCLRKVNIWWSGLLVWCRHIAVAVPVDLLPKALFHLVV